MKEETLIELGLSKNESKVYLSLLELGLTNVGKIADVSKIHRTNIYDSLDKLTRKGLASVILKNGFRLYEASDPEALSTILEEKQRKLSAILPELLLSKQLAKGKSEVQIYEGLTAVKQLLDSMLQKRKAINVFGAPKIAPELFGSFIQQFHKKRALLKVQMNHIYNTDAVERGKYLNTIPFTHCKFLPEKVNSPVATNICGDEVFMILFNKEPKNNMCIRIKNPLIAQSYQNYFDFMWETAKEIPANIEKKGTV